MSEHSLPPDISTWPADPYRLLGVAWGASARDLRRAYLHLVRTYKPEHSPEQFRRIREAYETLLGFARSVPVEPTVDDEDRPSPALEAQPISPNPRFEGLLRDPWDLACEGDTAEAYRLLSDRVDSGLPREETYLQLYWLLVAQPALDPGRGPSDLLIRGLRACGPSAHRLRELLSREAGADPQMAIGDRLAQLLSPGTPPESLPEIAGIRWKAARRLDRWDVIGDDLDALRSRISVADEDTLTLILIAAASNLVWAEGKAERARLKAITQELNSFGRYTLDLAEPLFRLDFANELDKGLRRCGAGGNPISRLLRLPADLWREQTNIGPVFRRLFAVNWGDRKALISGIRPLLALSWDGQGQGYAVDSLIRSHVSKIAKDPRAALRTMQFVADSAPTVLARLKVVLDESGLAETADPWEQGTPAVSVVIDDFLKRSRWWRYRKFRRRLLDFCLREMIHPQVFVQAIARWPAYSLPKKPHLAGMIAADAPLIYVYRACELHRS